MSLALYFLGCSNIFTALSLSATVYQRARESTSLPLMIFQHRGEEGQDDRGVAALMGTQQPHAQRGLTVGWGRSPGDYTGLTCGHEPSTLPSLPGPPRWVIQGCCSPTLSQWWKAPRGPQTIRSLFRQVLPSWQPHDSIPSPA